MKLSLNSFLELSSPTTTKMMRTTKNHYVTMMLDSGATQNFIAPNIVLKTHLRTKSNAKLEGLLGT